MSGDNYCYSHMGVILLGIGMGMYCFLSLDIGLVRTDYIVHGAWTCIKFTRSREYIALPFGHRLERTGL